MQRTYYVGVFEHTKQIDSDGNVHWNEVELEQWTTPQSGKARADELNEQHRTPDRFHSARMVWL